MITKPSVTYRLLADWFAVQIEDTGEAGGGPHLEAVAAEAGHGRVCVGGVVRERVQLCGGRAQVVLMVLVPGLRVQVTGRTRDHLKPKIKGVL